MAWDFLWRSASSAAISHPKTTEGLQPLRCLNEHLTLHYQRKPAPRFSAANHSPAPLASILGSTVTISTLLSSPPSPGGFLVWCTLGICGGIYLFVQGFRLLQQRQLILNPPASKIRSASMGMVELSGLAVGPYTIVAPITTRACYCYRTFVWEWKQSGKNK